MSIFRDFFAVKQKPVFTGSRFGFGAGADDSSSGGSGTATGRTTTTGGSYNYHVYLTSTPEPTKNFTVSGASMTVDYLVIGGGGGGGRLQREYGDLAVEGGRREDRGNLGRPLHVKRPVRARRELAHDLGCLRVPAERPVVFAGGEEEARVVGAPRGGEHALVVAAELLHRCEGVAEVPDLQHRVAVVL